MHTFAIPYAVPYALLRCCQENTSRFRDIFFVDDSALIAPQGVGVDSLTGLKKSQKNLLSRASQRWSRPSPLLVEGEGCDQEEAGARSDPQSVNFMPGLNWNCGKSPLCPLSNPLCTSEHCWTPLMASLGHQTAVGKQFCVPTVGSMQPIGLAGGLIALILQE